MKNSYLAITKLSMATFNILLLTVVLFGGCAFIRPAETTPFLPMVAKPGPKSELIYSYLKMEQAMRRDDPDSVFKFAMVLADKGPATRPLADAAGWLLGSHRLDEARDLLDKSVQALPDDLTLHIMLAETMLELEEADQAVQLLHDFHQKHPEEHEARIELGLLYLKTGEPQKCLEVLDSLPASAMTPTILYYQAQALRGLDDLPGTADKLREAIREAPDFLEAMLELAFVEEQQGNLAEASKLFETLLAADEGNQDILLRLVSIALKEGNPDRAFNLAASAQDSYSFILTASSLFMNENRYDLAEILLDKLAEQQDAPGEIAFYQAAVAYEGDHDIEKTLEILIKIEPDDRYYDRSLKFRSQVLYENNRLAEALELNRQGRELFPEDQDFVTGEIELLTAQKNYPAAIAAVEKILPGSPDDSGMAFRHAFLVDLNGDKASAMQMMEDLLTRFPDEPMIINYIGYSLACENRELDRALQLLTRAVELSPDSDYIVDSLAWVQYRLGQYQEAWTTIRRALSLAEPAYDATMWDHYGDIAYALGLLTEAREGWEKAMELDPEDPAAISAKLEKL